MRTFEVHYISQVVAGIPTQSILNLAFGTGDKNESGSAKRSREVSRYRHVIGILKISHTALELVKQAHRDLEARTKTFSTVLARTWRFWRTQTGSRTSRNHRGGGQAQLMRDVAASAASASFEFARRSRQRTFCSSNDSGHDGLGRKQNGPTVSDSC
jgi:hypothetical protein